jgi:hypothetical protein
MSWIAKGEIMSVAKIQEALDKLETLDDVLQDISPTCAPSWNWDEMTHDKLKSIRRMLQNELVYQEKKLLANFRQSNTACTPTDGMRPSNEPVQAENNPVISGESTPTIGG